MLPIRKLYVISSKYNPINFCKKENYITVPERPFLSQTILFN